jgi:hypothetical protein
MGAAGSFCPQNRTATKHYVTLEAFQGTRLCLICGRNEQQLASCLHITTLCKATSFEFP